MRAGTTRGVAALLACVSVGLLCTAVRAQVPAAKAADFERHVAAARAAAGTDHAAMVDRLCPAPTGGLRPAVRATGGPPTADPPRDSWHAEPQKVFDNFYFVGMTEFSSWAVTTTDGIIVIDPRVRLFGRGRGRERAEEARLRARRISATC